MASCLSTPPLSLIVSNSTFPEAVDDNPLMVMAISLNGRIDLSRAEAVIDVIHSQNEYALSSSVSQLKGRLSDKIRSLREDILYQIAFIESALDDPEHISLEGYPEQLAEKVTGFEKEIQKLLATADNGRLMKEGISTVIVG